VSEKTAVLRARCSPKFKAEVMDFLKSHYPEEDEAWIVRNAVKEFMLRQGGGELREEATPYKVSSSDHKILHMAAEVIAAAKADVAAGVASPKPPTTPKSKPASSASAAAAAPKPLTTPKSKLKANLHPAHPQKSAKRPT
jgi:hypothetical protein